MDTHTHTHSRTGLLNLRCFDYIVGCQRTPLFFLLTDEWSLRGILWQQGCRDDEMRDVKTKSERKCGECNTTDCTLGGGAGRGGAEGIQRREG